MKIEKIAEQEKEGFLIRGDKGTFFIPSTDRVILDFLMLIEGELGLENIPETAKKYGYHSVASYYNKRKRFHKSGLKGLISDKRGPKQKSKRTPDIVQKIVKLKFQRPEINSMTVAEILKKEGYDISSRSIERTFKEYGISREK